MMKAYLGIKFHPDDRNRETIELLSQTLASRGFEPLCVRRDLERWGAVAISPQQLTTRTKAFRLECMEVREHLRWKSLEEDPT